MGLQLTASYVNAKVTPCTSRAFAATKSEGKLFLWVEFCWSLGLH